MTGSTIATTTLSGNTIATPSLLLTSTVISLGQSTNSVYTRMSQGNAISTSSWSTSLTTANTATVSMSANAQTQLVVSQVSTTTSVQFTSTLGASWSALSNATGLPSATTTIYSAGAISGDGRYGVLGTTNGQLFVTANAGQSFSGLNTASPTIYLPLDTVPANGSSSSGTSPVTLTVTGTPTQAPSYVMGTGAIRLTNTINGGATQYIRGPIAFMPNCTISLWFNTQSIAQSIAVPLGYQIIFAMYSNTVQIYLNGTNQLGIVIPNGIAGGSLVSPFTTSLAINTWYNVTVSYQTNGFYYFYLNNLLISSGPIGSSTTYTSANFSLGTYDIIPTNSYPFNGYIDDVKIYNTAIPFTNLFPPQRFTNVAISNSGQYMLATMANQGLYLSSNYGTTFSPITGAMLSALWSSTQVSATGQYMLAYAAPQIVQPQLTGLTTSTWQVNGITWTVSASSAISSDYLAIKAFNNAYTSLNSWASAGLTYNPSTGGYTGLLSTTINGVGAISGEWLQLQTSVPIVMYSYNFASGGNYSNVPKTYYIVGSNDTISWYPIQLVSTDINPFTANFTLPTSAPILINQSGSQTMLAGALATLSCTTYSTNTTATYTYFRIIITTIYSTPVNSTCTELGEWYINFQAGGQTYSTNYGSTWNTGLPIYNGIHPQLGNLPPSGTTGVGTPTSPWQSNGVTWKAQASSIYNTSFPVSGAFDANLGTGWLSEIRYDGSGNPTIAPIQTTTVSGSAVLGEWIQIQSVLPLVMNSYSIVPAGFWQYPRSYTIAGSNNGTTWFTVQTVTMTVNPSGTTNGAIPSTSIIVAQSGIQKIVTSGGSADATCTPVNSSTPYIYFRIIAQRSFGDVFGMTEWYINFINGTQQNTIVTNGISTQALSGSGQYQLAANVTPSPTLLAQLNFEGTFADSTGGNTVTAPTSGGTGSGVTLSSAQVKVGTQSLFVPNVAGAGTPLSYELYTLSSFFDGAPAYTISTWIYPTALPASSDSVIYILTDNINNVCAYPYINPAGAVGIAFYTTTSGTTAYGRVSTTSISVTTWSHIVVVFSSGTALLYINGVLAIPPITYTGTVCIYNNTGPPTRLLVGAGGFAYGGYAGYIDDLRIYNTALTSTQIYTLYATTTLTPAIYVTQNFSTGVPLLPTITPALNSETNVPIASAVSTTGQYMIFVTNNIAGNNVYYSTNAGTTFTGLQLGTTPMTSAAISNDGSYITVSNTTTVYTLNNNSSGYTVAIGNQAGAINQYQNAIAIGNYAGNYYQYSNSIILNATGSPLNSANQGFYVAPITQYTASSSQTFSLLGYGTTDNQIVQSGVTFSSAQQTIYGEWIQYQLATPVSITSYVLQPRGSFPDRYPVAWTLVGSADGVNWTILDSQSGKTSTLWGVSYLLPTASPVYSFIRIIFTQVNNLLVVNGTGYVDIAGFILSTSGGPIFGSYTGYTTLAAGLYNILLYNSIPVCTITFSRPNTTTQNSFGIAAGAASDATFPPAIMATSNGYTVSTIFISMYYALSGSTLEYSPPNYIATRGTSTVVTAPLIQTQDLTGNTKYRSSSLISLDVNGTTQTQQLQFLDGSIQNTASQLQPSWGSFGQLFTWSPMPLSIATQTNVAISASGQYISIVNTIDNASTISISSTYGQTWTTIAVNTKGLGSNKMECVNVSGTGQYQLASCSDIGLVYGSSTYGQTWAPVYTGSIIMRSPGLSYTGQYQTIVPLSGSSNVLISSTYGQSWTPINIGTAAAFAGNVGISYSGQYQVLAVQTGTPGIYTSSTYGQTWTLAYSGSAGWNYVAISSSGQYQIATIYNGLVYLSINYGQSFAATSLLTGNWRGCAISSTGQYMACTNDATIAYSTTYGQSWSATTVRATGAFYGLGMSASGQYMIAGGSPIADGVSAYLSVVPSYSPGTVVIGSGTIATPLGMTLLASTSGFGGYDFKCSTTFTAVSFNSIVSGGNVGYQYIYHDSGATNGSAYLSLLYNNVVIGGISQLTISSVAYNTNSDYRLKSNVTPLSNSISRLQQLKPVSYTWTADNIDDIGFIAHEFKEVFPLNVTGEKDEVDEEGKPKYQQMSPNVCIPLLVSCVQEQQTEITDLKTQLASNSTRIETLETQLSQVLQRLAAVNIA
jgi:hypothetical protein